MQAAICYYSGSGNTKLACKYLTQHIQEVPLDFINVTETHQPDLEPYDIVGFATFTDFFAPPQRFQTFLTGLSPQKGKYAFVFNTYGSFSGKTLKVLAQLAATKGYRILSGHSLHTPESYPPLNALGITSESAPKPGELEKFEGFVDRLATKIETLQAGGKPEIEGVQLNLLQRLMPALPRTTSQTLMGDKQVDVERCTECGICVAVCPYEAIELNPKPVFDETRCYGCWACYNHCPEQAIFTKRYRDVGHYAEPNAALREKLGG
jgi:ferredoxin/flavodoxin